MKHLIIAVLSLIFAIASKVCWIWPIIEFILYLVKDREFHWWSVWWCLIIWVCELILIAVLAFLNAKNDKERPKKFESAFEKRLKEMSEKRNQKNN